MASTQHIQAIHPSRKRSRTLQRDDGVFTTSATSSEIPPDLVTAKEGDEESKIRWALRNLYNFTIASCLYFLCCLKLKQRVAKLTGDETDSEERRLINDEEALKKRLRFHFMNPFQKWKYSARRRFPWKFILQIVSTILVTAQVGYICISCSVHDINIGGESFKRIPENVHYNNCVYMQQMDHYYILNIQSNAFIRL